MSYEEKIDIMDEADLLMALIKERTGLKRSELECPREKTAMTPCVARDGGAAMLDEGFCVGCGAFVMQLLEEEKQKHK